MRNANRGREKPRGSSETWKIGDEERKQKWTEGDVASGEGSSHSLLADDDESL